MESIQIAWDQRKAFREKIESLRGCVNNFWFVPWRPLLLWVGEKAHRKTAANRLQNWPELPLVFLYVWFYYCDIPSSFPGLIKRFLMLSCNPRITLPNCWSCLAFFLFLSRLNWSISRPGLGLREGESERKRPSRPTKATAGKRPFPYCLGLYFPHFQTSEIEEEAVVSTWESVSPCEHVRGPDGGERR